MKISWQILMDKKTNTIKQFFKKLNNTDKPPAKLNQKRKDTNKIKNEEKFQ